MNDQLFYVVVKGTNKRLTLRTPESKFTPRIYDTMEIAQDAIDARNNTRVRTGQSTHLHFTPIRIAEYNEKYLEAEL
jgi:hypothetical protein